MGLLGKNLASLFDLTFHSICPNKQPPIFGTVFWSFGKYECVGLFVMPLLGLCATGDFLNEFHMYEDLRDLNTLKAFMETQLDDYNQTPGLVPMSLVLFRDAIEHSASKTQHTAYTLAADRAQSSSG